MRTRSAILTLLLIPLLAACSLGRSAQPTAAPSDTPVPPSAVPATPASPLAILVLPADMDKAASSAYESAVYDLSQETGMRFQVRNSLDPKALEPGLQVVIALPPDPGIAALAAAAPQVQFLAIDIPGITASANVSVLAATSQPDLPAFVAGYTAAMLSEDHHIGMLLPRDNPDAQRAAAAFANGMAYYCGLCQPVYYLPYTFPQYQDIPSNEQKARYPAYADILLVQHKVDTVYLYPDIAVKELTDYLSGTGTGMIGSVLPNPKPAMWVMTIRPDEIKAIQKAWPDLVAGKGGQAVQSPLGLADVNSQLLSPGKQQRVEQVLNDLLAGRIATGAAP